MVRIMLMLMVMMMTITLNTYDEPEETKLGNLETQLITTPRIRYHYLY